MSEIEYITDRSYDECMNKLRSLYGNNFQVIKKRFVKTGGFLGFFQHDAVRVSYVVTEQIPSIYSKPIVRREPEKDFEKEKEKILGMSKNPVIQAIHANQTASDTQEEGNGNNLSYQKLLDEMKSIKKDISQIRVSGTADEEPDSIAKIRVILENNEFSPSYIRSIVERIRSEFSLEGLNDFEKVRASVFEWIKETISIDDMDANDQPKIIILVGPTGVGKTTTVAKLAARFSPPSMTLAGQKKVHIITIDNYRLGGKEQIETYAQLMGIGINNCKNAEELEEIVSKYVSEVETILIDTIGYSPKDFDHISKMRKTLSLNGLKTDVYLAMMASTKASDMREIMQKYEIFGYDDVIITKLDETGCVGNLISIVSEKGKKFAWLTTGQKVPADIENASAARLMGMLSGFKVNREYQDELFPAE